MPNPRITIRILIYACFAVAFALFFFPLSASAHRTASSATIPTFRVIAGFNSRYRDGNWIPIQISLRNDGPDFNGTISLSVPVPYAGAAGSPGPLSTYQETINLPSGAQKQVTLYVPFYLGSQGITQNIKVVLLDANGHEISSQAASLSSLGPGDIFVGLLSDQSSSSFSSLSAVPLPNQSAYVITEPLTATTFPTVTEALNNFDLIVLDNFTTGTLSKDQLATLENWVNRGGNLIIAGGPEWRRTLSTLPANLLPVSVSGTTTLPAGTHLLPFVGPLKTPLKQDSEAVSSPLTVSTALPTAGSAVLLSSGTTPLIVQAQRGQGQIYYLAFDPTLDPIISWRGGITLWRSLLLRNLGDQLLAASPTSSIAGAGKTSNSNSLTGMGGILQSLFPTTFLATDLIRILLLGYVLVLGPVRFLLVRQLKNRDWSWRILLSTIALFSLLSYGLALQQKGTSILSSSISVTQLSQPDEHNSSMAHITTYVGVFVPNQGDFSVHIPGFNLVQPSNEQSRPQSSLASQQPTIITATPNGTDANMQGVNIWTLRTLISKHDRPISGSIIPQLTLQNNTLTGTVTNKLPYALSDAYVLIYGHYVSLGRIAVGQTKVVKLLVTPKDESNGYQATSIADQIARDQHLFLPCCPTNGSQPLSEVQRHVAMLAALSGETPLDCSNNNCTQTPNGLVTTSNGFVLNGSFNPTTYAQLLNGNDPLQIPNAPATLIGWADRPTDTTSNVTINGSYTSKVQEALIQTPLSVAMVGKVDLPPAAISGQLVDVQSQGTDIQTLFPGVYAISRGSMTFEYTLPTISHFQARSLIVSTPSSLTQLNGSSGQGAIDAHLQPSLYNWRTHSWDTYQFSAFSFLTNTPDPLPYIGPGGRILLQLTNQDSAQVTAVFGKPLLSTSST